MTSETRATLLERVGGDRQLLREIVTLFAEDAPEHLEAIRRAIPVGDAKALTESAHSLKGSAANFEAGPAADLALRLERMGRAGSLEGAADLCDALAKAIDDLLAELSKLCEETGA
jgi:HPt (histidine-containing phosphotransfer) domain-containing protein